MIVRTALLTVLFLAGCGGKRALVPGRIVVGFETGMTESAGARIIENNGLGVAGDVCVKPRTLPLSGRKTVLDAAVPFGEEDLWRARLSRIPGVESVERCYEKIKE